MKKTAALLLALLLAAVVPASAETVVTSFYPVWLLTRSLTGNVEGVDVVNLTAASTGCLHDYTLQNSDMVALAGADVLLVNGAGMEPFLPAITAAYPDLPVVDASAGIDLIGEEKGVNPHFWLDPRRAMEMAANLADGLILRMPQYREQIAGNLENLRGRLQALDDTFRNGSLGSAARRVILFHDAFPYFTAACGLSPAAVISKEPEDELSTSLLVDVLKLIRSLDPVPLIVKSTEEDRSVNVLVAETGVPVCELDPLTSGPEDPPEDYYEAVMLRNFSLLESALR